MRSGLLVLALLLTAPEAAGQTFPVFQAELTPSDLDPLTDEACDLSCMLGWSTTVTSSLPDQGANRYTADRLEDRTLSTAWVEGQPDEGVGDRITFTFTALPGGASGAIALSGIELVNGYAKDDATWRANARVRRLKVYHNGRTVGFADLLDTRAWQMVGLPSASGPEVVLRPGDTLDLEIVSVYPGTRFADTAISEILLWGAQ